MEHISKNQIKYVRSLQQKKVRDAEGVFVAEGHKCIEELMKSFECKMLITDEIASSSEIEQMSSLRTPQGEIAVFKRPTIATLPAAENELVLALDGVQDPGNLGTIIRTADWFGIRDIVCSPDTADCWNPKVVQATMGALARVRVHYTNLAEWIGEQRGCAASRAASAPNVASSSLPKRELERVFIYGTLLDGRNMYQPNAIPQKQNGIIVMGNEGNGISPLVRNLITNPLFIPSYPAGSDTSESLNVAIATAVILAEFRRPE